MSSNLNTVLLKAQAAGGQIKWPFSLIRLYVVCRQVDINQFLMSQTDQGFHARSDCGTSRCLLRSFEKKNKQDVSSAVAGNDSPDISASFRPAGSR